ncbi:3848_t:CDS:2, partial [Funneliformis caledonium]
EVSDTTLQRTNRGIFGFFLDIYVLVIYRLNQAIEEDTCMVQGSRSRKSLDGTYSFADVSTFAI